MVAAQEVQKADHRALARIGVGLGAAAISCALVAMGVVLAEIGTDAQTAVALLTDTAPQLAVR